MKNDPRRGSRKVLGGFSLGGSFGAFLGVSLRDDFSLCQGVKSGLDTGVGDAGDARARPEQSNLRGIALGGGRGGERYFLWPRNSRLA
jgi:hypothetical protein